MDDTGPTSVEFFQQAEQLYYAALELDPPVRAAFLAEACTQNESLRREVESLLAAQEQAGSFIAGTALADQSRHTNRQPGTVTPLKMSLREINHYRMLAPLGQGGMGEVWLAEDTRLHRKVALKLLPTQFANDAARIRRFEQEAQAISALNHPNIITLFDLGRAGDDYFMATEFVDGVTLREHLREGARLPLTEAADVAIQVCQALAAAHAASIIHRDIKPENLMLRRDGYMKVLDFGLAHVNENLAAPLQAHLTDPGMVMGTASYMSPEQARGEKVDARSDVFSLGIVLYEMLEGRTPFPGASVFEVIGAILHREPEPMTQAPVEWQAVVQKALHKDRAERFSSADELLAALKRLRQQAESLTSGSHEITTVPGPPSTPMVMPARESKRETPLTPEAASARWVSRWPIAVGLLVGLAAVWLVSQKIWNRALPAVHPFQTSVLSRLPINGVPQHSAISADGRWIAYSAIEQGRDGLWLYDRTANRNVELLPVAEGGFIGLTFARASDWLYFVRTAPQQPRSLYRIKLDKLNQTGQREAELMLRNVPSAIALAPDGTQFAFTREERSLGESLLVIARLDRTGERVLARRKLPDFYPLDGPTWSPDGQLLATPAGSLKPTLHFTVVGVRLTDGQEQPLTTESWENVRRAQWLADGSGLVFAAEKAGKTHQLQFLTWPGGQLQAITNDLNIYPRGVSLTADEQTLVTTQEKYSFSLWRVNAGANAAAQALLPVSDTRDGLDGVAALSDGRVLYTSFASGQRELWLTDTQGRATALTTDARKYQTPVITPDGRSLVVGRSDGTASNLWRADLDGHHWQQLTHGQLDMEPQLTPDGRWVVYSSETSGKRTLWRVPLEGGQPEQLTQHPAESPVISPDGRQIACLYWEAPSGRPKIALLPLAGGAPTRILDLPEPSFPRRRFFRWSPDGQALTLIVTTGGTANLWNYRLANGTRQQLTHFTSDFITAFAWAADDKSLICARVNQVSNLILLQQP